MYFQAPAGFAAYKFIWIGIGLGFLYWFIEAYIHVIIFRDGALAEQILAPDSHEIWKRLLVSGLIILFSVYAQHSINVRRRTEAALHEREKELSLILENNPAGIMLVDKLERKVSWANSNALKMIGAPKEAVEHYVCHKHLCPDNAANCPVIDLGQQLDLSERTLLTADGAELPILKSVTSVKFDGRDHLLEAFFDLSDRKKMERDLKLAHAELNQIFQTASVGMRLVDREFSVLKMNKTLELLTGVSEADAIGHKCHEVFSGPMCFTPNCPITRILQGKESVECYVDKMRSDGHRIPCLLSAAPYSGPDGEFVGIVESFQDITALTQAQEVLSSERDKLQRILSNLVEGVSIVNSNHTIEYQNEILKKQFGDCVDRPCYASLRGLDRPCTPCLMHETIRTGETQHVEFETSSGRYFEQTYTPIRDVDEREKAVVLLRDVTEKKSSTAAMMRAEQLAALGELAAGVAHEINNPINGIINYAQILVNKSDPGSRTNNVASRVIKEGDRIARIVESLLSFARRKNEDRTSICINDILSDSLALTSAQLRKDNIYLKMDIAADLPQIVAQAHEIEQVFINIISNARDSLNQKFPQAHADKTLEIRARKMIRNQRPFISISFRDQGLGIPEDIIDKVKNPFFSTKTAGKRTGLGLSISHGIVEDHGGRLEIDSIEGSYAEVSVDLPAGQDVNS